MFASVIWPCVPVIVNEELHGTAYGIMTAAQNTAQFLVPFVLQRIYKNNNTYVPCEIFFLCCSISATLLAFGMLISDEFFNSAIMRRKTSGSFKEFQPVANDSTHSNIDSNQNIELTSKSLGISLQQLEVTNRKSYGTTTNHV